MVPRLKPHSCCHPGAAAALGEGTQLDPRPGVPSAGCSVHGGAERLGQDSGQGSWSKATQSHPRLLDSAKIC